MDLVEQPEAHVVILLLALLLGSSLGSGSGGSRCGGGGSCHGEGAGVSQELLDGLGLLEGDLGLCGNCQQILHAVHDAVGHGRHGGVPGRGGVRDAGEIRITNSLLDGQRDGSHVPDTGGELLEEVGVRDVQDLGVEDAAAVVHLHEEREQEAGAGEGAGAGDLRDDESVAEGADLQHVQQSRLGHAHTVTGLNRNGLS